ncbi:MAG: hypothetical protein KTR17_05280 [Cellvibrionaceae bacterium]|nr:hypothetical protein [Cellvibrionaceae bacterium]
MRFVHRRSYNATFDKDGWLDWINQRQDASNNIVTEFLLSVTRACLSLSNVVFMFYHMLVTLADSGLQKKIQQVTDQCAARISGSKDFENTFLVCKRAEHAQSEVLRKMLNTPGALRLVRDLPTLASKSFQDQPDKIIEILNDDLLSQQPSWYHNKVAVHQRINWSADLNLAAGVKAGFASINVIDDYETLSEQVSRNYYESIGLFVNKEELLDVSAFVESFNEEEHRAQKTQMFFNGTFKQNVFWLFPLAKQALKLTPEKKAALLNNAIARLRKGAPDYLKVQQDLPILTEQMRKLSIANEIRKGGYRIPSEYYDIKKSSKNFSNHFNDIKAKYLAKLQAKNKYCELMGLRTLLAVSLANKKDDIKLGYISIELLRELEKLYSSMEKLQMAVSFLPVAEARMRNQKETNHRPRIQKIFREVLLRCEEVFQRLRQHQWPLDKDHATAEDYLLSHAKRLDKDKVHSVSSIIDYYQKVMLAMKSANAQLNGELSLLASHYENLFEISKLKVVSLKEVEKPHS